MNIQQALKQANDQLDHSSTSALLDAQVLLSHVLNCNTAHLLAWPEEQLSELQQTSYFTLITQREQGHPVAHLTGSREFWSLDFLVDNSTLIPRPETETLIEYILPNFSDKKHLKLLDMGTGTGAIAITIASEKPDWEIVASDISPQALALAAQNNDIHNTRVKLILSDWFDEITDKDFDIIVSNPPYIEKNDPHLSQDDVRFEPATALVSGDTGMDDIEMLCARAKTHLATDGRLIIEHGYNQQQLVLSCFEKNGFSDIIQLQDLSGHIRMTTGKKL